MKILDLTATYENGMKGMSKWHPIVELKHLATIEEVGMNTSSLLLGSHIGTHMDAQNHFIPGGYTIEDTPLESCMGDVVVVDARMRGRGDCLRREDLERYELKERVLLVFGWAERMNDPDDYNREYPYISAEAADYLLEKNVKLVAMDSPSPDRPPLPGEERFPIHKKMLAEKVIFVEALADTDKIDFGAEYLFCALPLKLKGTDASPCRVILIEKQ